MGKHKRHGTWKGRRDKAKKDQPAEGYDITTFTTENKAFEAYYKLQLHQEFANEAEFAAFKAILREKLPVVFRINENVPNFTNFLQKVKSPAYIEKLLTGASQNGQNENNENNQPQEETKDTESKKLLEQLKLTNISWYPRELVWQLNTFRHELKKNKLLQNLHKFIHKAFQAGLISRQELVSMLPPLLLDVKSTDIILDMCAAPGSKTAQLLEILYRDESQGKGLTQGGVVANDVDYNRASMLIHQVQRISTAGMMVVNHSGQHFPALKTPQEDGLNHFLFDKVLADVPCTGDGAIRKLPQKWAKWTCKDGIALHPLQIQILIRAIQVAKPGGLILYSTCSINPVEDEAVIAEIFRRCTNDSIELVDIREKVPGLIARPGLVSWVVCDEKASAPKKEEENKTGEETIQISKEDIPEVKDDTAEKFFNIYQSADQLPEDYKGLIRPSMFPDSPEIMRDVYKIQNSVRIMPHDQNTGGFYLALIRKKENVVFNIKGLITTKQEDLSNVQGPTETSNKVEGQEEEEQKQEDNEKLSEKAEELVKAALEGEEAEDQNSDIEKEGEDVENKEEEKVGEQAGEQPATGNSKKKSRRNQEKKKVTFEKFEPEEWDWIKEYYGLKDDSLKDLLIQQTQGDRRVTMISPGIKKILDFEKHKTVLNKLNMGAKALFKNRDVFLDNKYPYRLCQDAILSLFPLFTKRKLKCSAKDLLVMVDKQNVRFNDLPSEDLKQKVKEAGQGCFVLYTENDGPIQELECLVCLCHGASVSIMVSVELIESLKLRYLDLVQ